MSNTANWSYTNKATIKPFIKFDQWTGETIYGEPFDIDCTWAIKTKLKDDAEGNQFLSNYEVFTEDLRPKYMDLIKLSTQDKWEKVKLITEWDMSFFGEKPDLKITT